MAKIGCSDIWSMSCLGCAASPTAAALPPAVAHPTDSDAAVLGNLTFEDIQRGCSVTPESDVRLKVLTINMALVTPVIGTLKHYLLLCLAGMVIAATLYVTLAFMGFVRQLVGAPLIFHGIYGTSASAGFRMPFAFALGVLVSGGALALYYIDIKFMFYICAGYGFCQLTFFFLTVLFGQILLCISSETLNSYIYERIDLFLHHLDVGGPYDLVCIQEASVLWGCTGFRRALERGAAELGLKHVVWTGTWPRYPAVSANTGLGFLSRHPISQPSVRRRFFRDQYALEWPYVTRGALFASVHVPGARRVDICNLHNTASVENTSTGSGCGSCCVQTDKNTMGARQVLEALEWFKSIFPLPSATELKAETSEEQVATILRKPPLRILCGDLNFEKHTESFKMVSATAKDVTGLIDVVPDSDATFGNIDDDGGSTEWCLTFTPDQKRPRCLDHIFANQHAVSSRVVPMRNNDCNTRHLYQQASDHQGVEAVFEI